MTTSEMLQAATAELSKYGRSYDDAAMRAKIAEGLVVGDRVAQGAGHVVYVGDNTWRVERGGAVLAERRTDDATCQRLLISIAVCRALAL